MRLLFPLVGTTPFLDYGAFRGVLLIQRGDGNIIRLLVRGLRQKKAPERGACSLPDGRPEHLHVLVLCDVVSSPESLETFEENVTAPAVRIELWKLAEHGAHAGFCLGVFGWDPTLFASHVVSSNQTHALFGSFIPAYQRAASKHTVTLS